MKKLRRFTIGMQLNFLALFPTSVALLAAIFILAQSTKQQFEHSLRHELGSLTAVIAQAAEASLLFNDSGSAQRFLDALSAKENIVYATVLSREGGVLAEFRRHKNAESFSLPQSDDMICNGDFCAATRLVFNAGETLGRVSVVSDLSGLVAQGRENSRALLIAVFIGFLIALPIVSLLRRFIAAPLLKIAQFIGGISSSGSYSSRLPIFSEGNNRNEISIVVNGLNDMLDYIDRRDRELIQARELAQQASRAKSDFVANTSHEIRTPINNIIGFTEILADTVEQPEQQRYVDLIKYSADSLLTVINDILDLSKIEAGRMELSPIENDVVAALGRTCTPIEVLAANKGLKLSCQFDPSFPTTAYVDSDRLGQVLVNLLNNAIKFTSPPGKITVSLKVLSQNSDQVSFSLSVSDTGIGIPEAAQSKIFEAFQQADASTTRRYGGTGLGLSISRSIMRLMGGGLSLESAVGKGTTFTATATIATRSSVRINHGSPYANKPEQDSRDSKEHIGRVLVVEDNPLSREIALHRLRKSNFQVSVANNGFEAVELYAKIHFDLILMDCQMPGMDGFEATQRIREIEASRQTRTLIVALTAHAMTGYRDVCIQAGMDQYITKPITEAALIELITTFSAQVPAFREERGGEL